MEKRRLKLGINGLGRIGKLTLWHHVARKYFEEIIVNIGREVGNSVEDLAHYIERDSTYGSLQGYLYGHKGGRVIAESVRIPNTTGSLIILVVNLQEDISGKSAIRRDTINAIFKEASQNDTQGYLHYTDEQNVSGDIIGLPRAAAIIEGHETHTRTAEVSIDLQEACGIQENIPEGADSTVIKLAITQTVIYGWYDNELGGYVNMLGDRTVTVADHM